MAVLAPISGLPRFRNGLLVADARAFFYDAGTTTPRVVYQDAAGSPHANPVEVLGDGNFPAIYVQGSTAYKIRLEDGAGVLLIEYDQLQGEVSTSDSGGGGGTTIPTGAEMPMYATGAVSGWVRENGRTIGSASSGATERANADCEALFLHLWGVDANLAVSGGRGASAAADWAANKTIALPDARGRALVGLDDMGSTDQGRLVGGTFGFGDGTTLGSYGGSASHTLTEAQLAAHTHANTATASTNGLHSHAGATGASGSTVEYVSGVNTNLGVAAGAAGNAITSLADVVRNTYANHDHTIGADGSHTHTITVSNVSVGSGTAHNNLQPFAVRSIYIKL